MISTIPNINISHKRVLVAPLDWGLGHATRCIPIIKELIAQNFEVIIAAEKAGLTLLEKEFPHLRVLHLKGYRISYSKNNYFFLLKMFSQIPKINYAIKHENRWLNNIIKEYKIDIVIADNRYGLHNEKCYCIFITHQLNILTGNHFTEWLAKKINYTYINKFDECWVPDLEGNENLAGKLSHPIMKPTLPVKYIGILSRFKKKNLEKSIDLLILLSGPEPQRTLLEDIFLKQLKQTTLKTFFVRGLPNLKTKLFLENKAVEIVNHLPANELNYLISSAKTVVARSGYSTIMDLAVLQQAAILIPTPGQTEQEYLAKSLAIKKYCIIAYQKNLNLANEIQKISTTVLQKFPATQDYALKKIIHGLK